jgi:hypothetical protein
MPLGNPLRDEGAAFRLVLLVLLYAGLIVAGSAISGWVGLAVFIVLTTAAGIAMWLRWKSRPRDGAG